jgi:hypothetical protein
VSGQPQSDVRRLIGSWRHIGLTVGGEPRPDRGYEFAGDRLIRRPAGATTEVIWECIK